MPTRRQRTIFPGDALLQRIQASSGQAFEELARLDFLQGRLLSGIDFTSATAKEIRHHLGYKPRGAWLVNPYEPGVSPAGGTVVVPYKRHPGSRRAAQKYLGVSGTDSISFVLPFTPADGASLVLAIGFNTHTDSVTSISQTGCTWVKIAHQVGAGNPAGSDSRLELWWAYNVSGASNTLTITAEVVTGVYSFMTLNEFTGITSGTLVGSASATVDDPDALHAMDLSLGSTVSPGQLIVVAHGEDFPAAVVTNGWSLENFQWRDTGPAVGDQAVALFTKVAERSEDPNYFGSRMARQSYANAIMAAFQTAYSVSTDVSIASVPAIAITASDRDTITLYPTRTFTGDVWVY